MPLPEFGDGLDPEPEDIDRIMDLLPEHCRGCKVAEFSIGLLLSFESSTGGPWSTIEDINEHCTGYEGELEPSGIEAIDSPEGVRMGLFFPIDSLLSNKDRCPYFRRHDY